MSLFILSVAFYVTVFDVTTCIVCKVLWKYSVLLCKVKVSLIEVVTVRLSEVYLRWNTTKSVLLLDNRRIQWITISCSGFSKPCSDCEKIVLCTATVREQTRLFPEICITMPGRQSNQSVQLIIPVFPPRKGKTQNFKFLCDSSEKRQTKRPKEVFLCLVYGVLFLIVYIVSYFLLKIAT